MVAASWPLLRVNYVNYVNLGDVTLSEISQQPRQWQKDHFAGTPARCRT